MSDNAMFKGLEAAVFEEGSPERERLIENITVKFRWLEEFERQQKAISDPVSEELKEPVI